MRKERWYNFETLPRCCSWQGFSYDLKALENVMFPLNKELCIINEMSKLQDYKFNALLWCNKFTLEPYSRSNDRIVLLECACKVRNAHNYPLNVNRVLSKGSDLALIWTLELMDYS